MNKSTNYGLYKPSETDYFNIEDFNGNNDKGIWSLKMVCNAVEKLWINSYEFKNLQSRISII